MPRPTPAEASLVLRGLKVVGEALVSLFRMILVWFGLLDSIVLGVPRSAVGECVWMSTLRYTPLEWDLVERYSFNPLRSVFLNLTPSSAGRDGILMNPSEELWMPIFIFLGKCDLAPTRLLQISGVRLTDPFGALEFHILRREEVLSDWWQCGSSDIVSSLPAIRRSGTVQLAQLCNPTTQMASMLVRLFSAWWPQPGSPGVEGSSTTEERRVNLGRFSAAMAIWSVL